MAIKTPIPTLIEVAHDDEAHIPPEIRRGLIKASKADFVADADGGVSSLLHSLDGLCKVDSLRFKIWRAILDANRNPNDFSEDGIVKTQTGEGKEIWSHPSLPYRTAQYLIRKYIIPYQKEFLRMVNDPDRRAALLLHTMPTKAPVVSRFASGHSAGKPRPLFFLTNGGDSEGTPDENNWLPKNGMDFFKDLILEAVHKDLDTEQLDIFDPNNLVGFSGNPFGERDKGMDLLGRFPDVDRNDVKTPHFLLMEVRRDVFSTTNSPHLRELISRISEELARNSIK